MKTFVSFILMTFLISCTTGSKQVHVHEQFTKHYEESLFQVTEKGLFSVEMVIKDHSLTTGMNEVDIIIHDKDDNDVIDADITVTPWMPEMGHGVFDPPVIRERGGGLYSAGNVIISMIGHWELRVQIQKDGMEDRSVFDFPGIKIGRGHKHEGARKPADLDLSTSRLTRNKLFQVSYESTIEPIPINTIHSWIVNVQNAAGNPVVNAHMTVSGDMPEHGHGLPTQPEVTRPEMTQSLGSGSYRLDGVKFNMPGWWTLHFTVNTNSKEDSVTFNLFLSE